MHDLFGGDLDGRLAAFMAGGQTGEAAAARARRHWLGRVAVEEATLRGVLIDLAERPAAVVVTVAGGRRHRGRVVVVGADFCTLRPDAAGDRLVALDAITALRSDDGSRSAGERTSQPRSTFAGALAALAEDRPRVSMGGRDGTVVASGELCDVGRDVVVLRTDGEPALVYVPLTAIADVVTVA